MCDSEMAKNRMKWNNRRIASAKTQQVDEKAKREELGNTWFSCGRLGADTDYGDTNSVGSSRDKMENKGKIDALYRR